MDLGIDNDIVLVNGKVDPKSEFDVINLELIFSDLDQKRMERLKKGKAKDSQSKLKSQIKRSALDKIEQALMDRKQLENDLAEPENNPHVKEVMGPASELESGSVTTLAQVWDLPAQEFAELTEPPPDERTEYLKSLGITTVAWVISLEQHMIFWVPLEKW
ncbi:hypothetical protein MLD38_027060 [Melastoma candidum]|uniref:Uncharacterized protein n=1 Tax=Melastoma candidum TaxID=119954 RepID=A0ACB9P0J3_9MYRT|nr:hypothetical protein MLD38_027060 [Melastoma candidum]